MAAGTVTRLAMAGSRGVDVTAASMLAAGSVAVADSWPRIVGLVSSALALVVLVSGVLEGVGSLGTAAVSCNGCSMPAPGVLLLEGSVVMEAALVHGQGA